MRFFTLSWLTMLLLLVPRVASSDEEVSDLDPGVLRSDLPSDVVDGPLAVFAAVERAWRERSAADLVTVLDPTEKVSLSFAKGGPRGGYFNRDQAFFLLKDLLDFTKTEHFEFRKYWNLDSEGRSPYAVAVREFRMNDGTPHTDQVYISLRKRDDAWYVGEIRSIDR